MQQTISLETNWRYFPTEVIDAAYGASELDESSWGILPQLADYPRDLIAVSGTLNLRHTFDLEPIGDVCLRFALHLDRAPVGTQVYVNGWHLGTLQSSEPLNADITDYVSLEDNLVLVKLTHSGELRGLSIEPVPCET
ncbi:MAG: hypothetical protein GC179_24425 [Anaerolineaceae bacterium]|nr:hypothetical protein [Anaerolineaceae bacterium]